MPAVMLFYRTNQQVRRTWLQDIVAVGFVDSRTIGCLALDVMPYLSFIFIIAVVAIRFGINKGLRGHVWRCHLLAYTFQHVQDQST